MTKIAGRTAVVTGGGSGIGRALALALAKDGARVAVADISEARAAEVAGEIEAAGGAAFGIGCDVSDRASLRLARAQTIRRLGPASLLFANAGVSAMEPLAQTTPQDLDWLLSVNLFGVAYSLETFLPDMVARRDGHVVATASVAAIVPQFLPTHAPYAAAKAGVIAMMLNLRHELGQVGIGSTVLCPDGVTTRIAESGANRPPRFGGPAERGFAPPEGVDMSAIRFRPPEEVAEMTLRAVRANRPMVLTDAVKRSAFLEGYVNVVLQAFDEAAAFDQGTFDRGDRR